MKSTQIFSLLALVASAVGVTAVLMDESTSEAHHIASADLPTRARGLAGEDLELIELLGVPGYDPADLRRAVVAEGPAPSGRTPSGRGSSGRGSSGMADSRPEEYPKTATLTELRDFRAYVESTLSEVRQQEAAAKINALEARAARMDATMPTMENRLGLTPHQSNKMRSVLLSQLDREAEYVRLWAKGADEEILAELKKSDREARLEELTGFLTQAQLATYASSEGGPGR